MSTIVSLSLAWHITNLKVLHVHNLTLSPLLRTSSADGWHVGNLMSCLCDAVWFVPHEHAETLKEEGELRRIIVSREQRGRLAEPSKAKHGLLRTNQMCSTANWMHDIDNYVSPLRHCHRAQMTPFSLEGGAVIALVNVLIAPVFLVWAVYGAKGDLDADDKCCEGQLPVIFGTGCACSALKVTLMYLSLIGMLRLIVLLKRIIDITSCLC